MADLSDLEDHKESFQHLALYEAALLELSHGSVPCRALRLSWAVFLVEKIFIILTYVVDVIHLNAVLCCKTSIACVMPTVNFIGTLSVVIN